MIRKIVISLGVILLFSFNSCGGGSSKDAKELLGKILQFVGIPHSILLNVCQDSNGDGICGAKELFTKLTIEKGESIDDIFEKISLTAEGKYFLETVDPTLPILVELQDVTKVNYDDGKFTLTFNGFKLDKDDNETKEISILESMVDANVLTKNEADKFRTLKNTKAQDKYYAVLLDDLETNINTLRNRGFDSKIAVEVSIREMGEKTKINQEQANKINSCENNQTCVDKELKNISEELIIDDNKSQVAVEQNSQSITTEKDYSQYKGLNFDSVIIESSGCKNIILQSLSLSYSRTSYDRNNELEPSFSHTYINASAFCGDNNKKEKLNISTIKKAIYKTKKFEIQNSSISKDETNFSLDFKGDNIEDVPLNSFDYFIIKDKTDDEIFNRLSINSISDNCHDATIDSIFLQNYSFRHKKGELNTHISIPIHCSNSKEIQNQNESAEITYRDKFNKVHILYHDTSDVLNESHSIWVFTTEDIEGNVEQLSMNEGSIYYSAVGFEDSTKEYNVFKLNRNRSFKYIQEQLNLMNIRKSEL